MPIYTKGHKFLIKVNEKPIAVFNTYNEAKNFDTFINMLLRHTNYSNREFSIAKAKAFYKVVSPVNGKKYLLEMVHKKINAFK